MTNSLVNKTGKHKNGMTRRHRKQMIFIFTLMLFPISQWLIFWLYPNVTNLVLPFTTYDFFEGKIVFVGFENLLTEFEKVFSTPATRNAFLNSWRALPINFIILPISVIVGYAFSKHVPGERIFRILFFYYLINNPIRKSFFGEHPMVSICILFYFLFTFTCRFCEYLIKSLFYL